MLSGRVDRGTSNSAQRNFTASGFSLLIPSLTSSRPPQSIPNSSLSQSRDLDHPLIFDDRGYGPVIDWYNEHKNVGPTTIHKMHLRKEYRAPAHEFIWVLTRSNRAYRIDRSRGGPVLDTVMEQGVPPHDTITPLGSASITELDESSYCMVQLYWGDERTVDLSLVLNICFQIHYESGRRYKLLTHNCYFFSQTIIMIVVRKTVACGAQLDKALKRCLCERTWKLCWEAAWKAASTNLMLEPGQLFGATLEAELGPELGLALGSDLGLALGLALKGELERDRKKALKDLMVSAGSAKGDLTVTARSLKRDVGPVAGEGYSRKPLARRRPLGRVLGWMLGWARTQERAQKKQWNQELQQTQARVRELERHREQEQQREQWLRSQQQEQWQGQQLRERLQQVQLEWENIAERGLALELARRVLREVLELALSGELEPNWPEKRANPKKLAEIIPDKLVCAWYVTRQTFLVSIMSDM